MRIALFPFLMGDVCKRFLGVQEVNSGFEELSGLWQMLGEIGF